MHKGSAVLWISALVLLALTASGQATRIMYRSPKELADESPQIVRGKVASVRSFWNESRSKIFTEVLVAVDETYKGAAIREARVLQLGGIVGNVNMHVEGALSWKPNEEVLLMLEANAPGAYAVAGFSQGKFSIERDPRTGRPFVRAAALEGVELLGTPRGAASGSPKKVPLGTFISETLDRE